MYTEMYSFLFYTVSLLTCHVNFTQSHPLLVFKIFDENLAKMKVKTYHTG